MSAEVALAARTQDIWCLVSARCSEIPAYMEPWVKNLLVGDEHGVQGRFQQSVGQVLGKVLDARGIEARFADFKCLGSAYNNTPDVVLPVETIQDEQDEPSLTLSVVLLERSPWWLFLPSVCAGWSRTASGIWRRRSVRSGIPGVRVIGR